ncbi:helicase-like protein [Geodermatophilus normandii]|uniref:Helicase-like protein n=1 Tax=Geodermatophilus normandii TaxID=1137989 RepID=A0A317QJH9_9ACTN|nr:helicase-like protein [Geodermatophilus normandii]
MYCSDAADLGGAEGDSTKQIDQIVSGLCLPPLSIAAARYTYNEPPRVRADLERRFADGVLDALVAIRCLDEGVDIPSMRTAIIMASTTNPRQFVQRRGRVLRRFPGKDKATIYDLVVIPGDPAELPPDVFNVERRIFRRELMRVVEFARHAENSTEVLHDLLELRAAWNCLDI